MHSTSTASPLAPVLGPVGWLGRSVLAVTAYVGGVTLLAIGGSRVDPLAAEPRSATRRARILEDTDASALLDALHGFSAGGAGAHRHGLVPVASGLLRQHFCRRHRRGRRRGIAAQSGGMMTGLTFAGILAARMIPELRILSRYLSSQQRRRRVGVDPIGARRETSTMPTAAVSPSIAPGRLAAPRIAAAAIACLLLSQWGIAVGTLVGWQASQSMMGLPTETFFMMMVKMMWFRDVVGLIVKGLLFGALPAAICCYEGLGPGAVEDEPAEREHQPVAPGPWAGAAVVDAGVSGHLPVVSWPS